MCIRDRSNITGNIYKGKVVNVLTGLQSAFVNFGSARNGFLSVEEALGHKTVLGEAGVMPKLLDVKEGDYVMVQATKEDVYKRQVYTSKFFCAILIQDIKL